MSRILNLVVFMFMFGACAEVDTRERGEDVTDTSSASSAVASETERWSAVQRGNTELGIAFDGGDMLHSYVDNALVAMPITGLSVRETITRTMVRLRGTGVAQQVQIALIRADGNGDSTRIHTLYVSDPPATWGSYEAVLDVPEVVAAGAGYYWIFNIPKPNTYISTLGYVVE